MSARYRETLAYLFRLQRVGIKLGLDNINTLLASLKHPQNEWPAIHIAGTNGKGSTAAILEAILRAGGRRVGIYTSPHLVDFTERIRIDREPIPREAVIDLTERLRPLIERIQPSFFEVTTAMAFRYFADSGIDIAIIETGMGGRLDSTNVLHPLVSAVTPVDMDHQQYLGDSLAQIAAEKAGICKAGIPCVTNNRNETVLAVLERVCRERGASFINVYDRGEFTVPEGDLRRIRVNIRYRDRYYPGLELSLGGDHQAENLLLALGVLDECRSVPAISDADVYRGAGSVYWPGRMDPASDNPLILIDVSQNPSGVARTLAGVRRFHPRERIHAITFLQDDKDFQKIGELLVRDTGNIYIIDLKAGKPLDPHRYAAAIERDGGSASVIASMEKMFGIINARNRAGDVWLFIGSHYLAGEAYRILQLS